MERIIMSWNKRKQQSQSQQQTLPPSVRVLPQIPLPPPFVFPPPQIFQAMAAAGAGTKRPHGQMQQLNNKLPTEDELNSKKAIRKAKNRESARICRLRKKEAAKELERKIQILEVDNLKLRLQLKIGEEAEALDRSEEERLTRELEEMLRSGASEKEVDDSILCYTDKFADYGRDRRSAIEFHLRNVARLLQPTTTTSVAIRALEGTTDQLNTAQTIDKETEVSIDNYEESSIPSSGATMGTMQMSDTSIPVSVDATSEENPQIKSSSASDTTQSSEPFESKQQTIDKETDVSSDNYEVSSIPSSDIMQISDTKLPSIPVPVHAKSEEIPQITSSSASDTTQSSIPLEPKQLFQYLADYLQVNEVQSKALRDSRKVANELDAALEESLVMLEELKGRLTQCGSDLEVELDAVSKILNPTQVAKFLVWVRNNGACMHMLNELWKKEYNTSPSDNEDENDNLHQSSRSKESSLPPMSDTSK